MLQVYVQEDLALIPAVLSLAAIKAPKLKYLKTSTNWDSAPPLLHSISLLSNLEELELRDWEIPEEVDQLAISHLSGLRSLRVIRPKLLPSMLSQLFYHASMLRCNRRM